MAERESAKTPDYRVKVLAKLTNEASWPNKLVEEIAWRCRGGAIHYKKDPNMSGFHQFMERIATKELDVNDLTYTLAKPGEDKPDIMTKDFDIEIETGLKHDLTELGRKLANATKKTYIVVPGESDKERYKKAFNKPLIEVLRFDESLKYDMD